MTDFNDIGISRQLDWERIKKLLAIGFFSALLSFTGDMLLGWGIEDETLTGLSRMLSAYTGISDIGLFVIAMTGMIAVTLMGLCCFGIYRLMAEKAPAYAHWYKNGIFGFVIFDGCGFHVPVCALVYLAKHLGWTELVQNFSSSFLMPAFWLFWVFFLMMQAMQIMAFVKGMTPCPKWGLLLSLPVGMAAVKLLVVFGNRPWVNALNCAWIGFGGMWMFGGLLVTLRKMQI